MKKLQIFALAAMVAFGLASCAKDVSQGDEKQANLTIRIVGDGVDTRAIEGQATENGLAVGYAVGTGHIYILSPMGNLVPNGYVALTSAAGTAAGQTITNQVPADSRVFIIANAPVTDNTMLSSLTNWNTIRTAASNLADMGAYTAAFLTNSTGQPMQIDVDGGGTTATVTVALKPAISRLELVSLQGGTSDDNAKITAFTVTGVYVDDYYSQFTWGSSYSGLKNEIGSTGSAASLAAVPAKAKDEGSWGASGTSPLQAVPGGGANRAWAYNVASETLPRLIIKLENVKYQPTGGGAEVDLSGTTYYLTVKSYTNGGTPVPAFERGKIYRLGADQAFVFDKDDLGLTPNPVNLTLTVKVTVDQWSLVNLTPQL